jgi:arginase
MARTVAIVGVPTSVGAFAPGQELAPAALREAGLLEGLRGAGLEVDDHGDREPWRWRPDREERRAQNVGAVAEIVGETTIRVAAAAAPGAVTLVLGGDCTVGIGTVAGHVESGDRVGLLYFDTHADLNVPESVREGALDWMGVAHMLDEPGARPELARAGGRLPLLEPEQVVLFGWGPEQATAHEREAIARRGIATVAVDEVAADPRAAASRALELLEPRCERLLVHFDVDVVDFTDTPLSENTGRNEGLPFATALSALEALLASPLLAGLTIAELNPAHAEPGAGAIERLATAVASGLGD